MRAGRKVKVSVSLSPAVVGRIDRRAESLRTTRSAVMEEWLEEGERRAAERQLASEVQAYYGSQTREERAEDRAIAEASATIARTLDIDAEQACPPTGGRPTRRKPKRA
ncbi:MAG: ribbon-helix-helix protein, CopG family [Deltaproteobacteria bacterium]|nr:ribbon-helix-helix protein, CopG family [Deltaproteobacteria bacterium]